MLKGIFLDVGDTIIVEEEGKSLSDMAGDLVDGANVFLSDMAKRYKLVIVSNTVSSKAPDIERVLEKLGLASYISHIVTSQDIGIEKPAPGIFEEAFRTSGLRADEVVMIGDRVDTDILGANRSGIRSILLRWRDRHPMQLKTDEHKPTYQTASYQDIRDIIKTLS